MDGHSRDRNPEVPSRPAPGAGAGGARSLLSEPLPRLLLLIAGLVVALWLLKQIVGVLLLLFFVAVLAIALNAPTTALQDRGLPRLAAALLVFAAVLLVMALLGWLIVPRLVSETVSLIESIPTLVDQFTAQLARLLRDHPEIEERLQLGDRAAAQALPWLMGALQGLWHYSFSAVALVVLAFLFASIVLYVVISPLPLLRLYLVLFPEARREQAARAFSRSSDMVVGYMRSNLIVGAIEAVLAFVFLSLLGIPGALLWAAFTFFAEFVPKLGPYLMAAPPVLVAFSVDPLAALWTALFYLVLNETMGNLVVPRVRRSTMDLHPAFSLVAMLLMGAAFGLLGALAATPMAGVVKAYTDEFFLKGRQGDVDRLDRLTQDMLRRQVEG